MAYKVYTAQGATTATSLTAYIRELTDVLSTDLLTDSRILDWINEVYSELANQQEWTWSNTAAPAAALAAETSPAFPAQFHPLIAFKVACKVLEFEGDTSGRIASYLAQYNSFVAALFQDDLQIAVTGTVVDTGAYTDLTFMTKFVRKLINTFDGTYSNAFIQAKILDEYRQLCDAYTWTFSYATTLEPIKDYARILGYGVAAKLGAELGLPENTINAYIGQYNAILDDMKLILLENPVTGTVVNAGDYTDLTLMTKYVRKLLNVFDNSISNTLIQNRILDEYRQLCAGYTWTFSYSTSIEAIKDYARILAYGVAARLGTELGLPQPTIDMFREQYGSILENMKRTLLYVTGGAPTTLATIRKYTRALLLNYATDMPDNVLNSWINERYTSLQGMRDWVWLNQEYTANLSANSTTVSLPALATSKIKGIYLTSPDGSIITQAYPRAHLMNKSNTMYATEYSYTVTTAGVITLSPPVRTDCIIKVRYSKDGGQLLADGDATLFDSRFNPILAYSAAQKGLYFSPNNSNQLMKLYSEQENSLINSMISYYELSHNLEPFRIGSDGLRGFSNSPQFGAI